MTAREHRVVVATERLVLRHFEATDAGAMESIFCDPDVMRFSDGVEDPQWVRTWLVKMIEECYPHWGFGLWAVEETQTGAVIGYCGLEHCDVGEGELGYRLRRDRWGRGYATEAARATCELGLDGLGLKRIVALIDPANAASLRVVSKLGMQYEREVMLDGYTHPDQLYVLARL